jgi:hypothetical protein
LYRFNNNCEHNFDLFPFFKKLLNDSKIVEMIAKELGKEKLTGNKNRKSK